VGDEKKTNPPPRLVVRNHRERSLRLTAPPSRTLIQARAPSVARSSEITVTQCHGSSSFSSPLHRLRNATGRFCANASFRKPTTSSHAGRSAVFSGTSHTRGANFRFRARA